MKRLIKSFYDTTTRDVAVIYIDGEVLEGKTHAEIINKYLNDHGFGKLNDTWFRPYLFNNYRNLNNEEMEDVELIKENIKSIAFAHRVDRKNGIFIDTSKLYNIDLNTVINTFKNEYKGYDIYDDNSYNSETLKFKQLAQKRLIQSKLFKSKLITNEIYKYISPNYYECFKNPSSREWRDITNVNNGYFRGILIDNGDLYIFNNNILHEDAIDIFNIPDGLYISGNRDIIDIYPCANKYLYEAFTNGKSIFNYLTIETEIEDFDKFSTVNDILNFKGDI